MITSEYLEQIVNFNLPILVVGPGIRITEAIEAPPMDTAVLWFAEKLYGRHGRLDILDLPKQNGNGGCHDPAALKRYMTKLSSKANLGEINYLYGDVAKLDKPDEEYGLIWDHGTLQSWSHVDPDNGMDDTARRTRTILENYSRMTHQEGKICLCASVGRENFYARVNHVFPAIERQLGEDSYHTSLTHKQLNIDRGDLIKTGFLKEDLLFPSYSRTRIIEIRK